MILFANNLTKKEVRPAVREYEKWSGDRVEVRTGKLRYPIEDYNKKQRGANRQFLKALSEGADEFFFLDPEVRHKTSHWGFFHKSVSTKKNLIASIYTEPKRKTNRSEFKYHLALMLAHEKGHALAFKYGVRDRTHYFQDKDNLKGMFEYLEKKKHSSKVDRILTAIWRLYDAFNKDVECEGETVVIHHTATQQNNTNLKEVRKNAKNWYNDIIYKGQVIHWHDKRRRGYKEVAVVGQFVPGERFFEEPSEENLNALRNYIGDCNHTTHNKLGKEGVATQSQCPGILKYRL